MHEPDHAPDPYRAPAARIDAELPQERLAIEAAGRWRRFFNWLIDYVAIRVFWNVAAGMYLVWHMYQGDTVASAVARYKALPTWFFFLYGLATIVAYYVLMEGFFGVTIGKLVTGARVVDEQGGRPTWRQVLIRTAMRFVPLEPISAFGEKGSEPLPWHDTVAKTRVVRRRR